MSTWLNWFRGQSANSNEEETNSSLVDGAEIATLPKYDTFNDLPPQFQLTPEHDENHIFPEELELVEKVREALPEVSEWPTRYVLIFLFARRHSLPHTVQLLKKHLKWLLELGCAPITKTNLYPFKPEQLDKLEMQYALFGGFTLFKHNLVDKHNRLLRYQVMRFFFPGQHNLKDYMLTTIWWYYYTLQFVPLSVHRNGHSVVVDMKDMGWNNISFSIETQKTLATAVTGLPGRMRVCWMVNTNWMLTTAMTVAKLVLSAKILGRLIVSTEDDLKNEIDLGNIPRNLGGEWEPNLEEEWYGKVLQLEKEAEIQKEMKGDI